MRMNKETTRKAKVINHDPNEKPGRRKTKKTWLSLRNRLIVASSMAFLALISFFLLSPPVTVWAQREAAIADFHAAIPMGYDEAMAQDTLADAEAEFNKQKNELKEALICEAQNRNAVDMTSIGRNIIQRATSNSTRFADTIYDVINQKSWVKTKNGGLWVWQYSYKVTNAACPPPSRQPTLASRPRSSSPPPSRIT